MRFLDTHAHLCDPAFVPDLDEVLQRAAEAGVRGVVAVSETLADARRNLELSEGRPAILPAAGLFPTILDRRAAKEMETFVRGHAGRLVAIGEVGLDYWKVQDAADRELQREILAGFVALARELDLPLNVHSRSAGHHTIDFLLEHGSERVHMHAFDGKAVHAERAVEAGFVFSVPPSVVRSAQKQKLARRLPLSHLMLETDSPVLGVEVDARNEPAQVARAAAAVAELKGLSVEEVAETTFETACRFYKLPLA